MDIKRKDVFVRYITVFLISDIHTFNPLDDNNIVLYNSFVETCGVGQCHDSAVFVQNTKLTKRTCWSYNNGTMILQTRSILMKTKRFFSIVNLCMRFWQFCEIKCIFC